MAADSKKLGVYLCSGCDIGNALDTDKLAEFAGGSDVGASVCRTHAALCSVEGVALINKDIAEEGVDTVVIAACSPRVNTEAFDFDPSVVLDRANLREQVAWCQEPGHEDTQMLAEDYLRMSAIRAKKSSPAEPYIVDVDKSILVVGGGLAGLTAAFDAAEARYKVVLVEREAEVGGWMAQQHKQLPTAPPYRELEPVGVAELADKVNAHANITVHTGSTVQSIAGAPGLFDVTIATGEQTTQTRVGAVIQADGAQAYDAGKLDKLGFGSSPNVVTADDLEAMARGGKITRPSDGQPAKQVVFIQCAGSRDAEHLAYCSSVCCARSLKQALYVRELDPEAKAYIIYKDMRTPGHYEDFYRRVQEDPGVFLTKGEVSEVAGSNGSVSVTVQNTLLGEDIALQADLVVLATGMVKANPEAEDADSVLNLQYRLGTDLPQLQYGFPDSHFICFPYETRRTGVYAAGATREPLNEMETIADGRGAAMKAIQCVEMTSRGETVHPRAGDTTYPAFFMQRCTQCKRCTEECPFGALNEDEKGTPLENPTRCRRCGICLGACPERIVSFANFSPDIVGSAIKCVEIPEEDEEKPRVLVLACENDAMPAIDMIGQMRKRYSPYIRIQPVRCLGSVNLVWIADALSTGFDAIVLIGCKYGDDYQCHYIKGSELANTRSENIQETLQKLVLEPERVQLHQVAINEWEQILQIFEDVIQTVEEVGPNPYKEF